MKEELTTWFETFAEIGKAPEGGGYYRGSYTEVELEEIRLLTEWMEDAGFSVHRDAAGNLWGKVCGSDPDAASVVTGSHMDSVRNGGNYDGIVGVLGSISAVKGLIREHGKPRKSIEVVAFTGEEGSRFSIGLMGSHASAGTLNKDEFLQKCDSDGISVVDAMQAVGLDASKINDAVHEEIDAYIEMHIEQGPVLEREGIPIGIVSTIVGTQQFRVTIHGTAGHAGTVPMNSRQDPMVFAARAISRFPDLAKSTGDGFITVGRIWAKPDAENVIPSEVTFSVDLRHPIEDIKQEMVKSVKLICEEEAAPSGKAITWLPFPNNLATQMDEQLRELMKEACKKYGYQFKEMPSGAGHDALNMAKLGRVALLFIPCKDGRSHCPEEYTSIDDVQRGVDVLQDVLFKLAY